MATVDDHSFRWGCPTADDGFVQVPNFILRQYANLGLSGQEFLVILHLAAYRYETAGAASFPSIATIAEEMRLSERRVQQLLARLEERGMVHRHYRDGRTTVYDVSGYAQAARAAWEQERGEAHFTPKIERGEAHFTPGVKPTSPEEENIRREHHHHASESVSGTSDDDDESGEDTRERRRSPGKSPGARGDGEETAAASSSGDSDVPVVPDDAAAFQKLMTIPDMDPVQARRAAAAFPLAQIEGWTTYGLQIRARLDNAAAYVLSRLASGEKPPLVDGPAQSRPDHGEVVEEWDGDDGTHFRRYEDGYVSKPLQF